MLEYQQFDNGVEGYSFFYRKGAVYFMGREDEAAYYVAKIDANAEGKYIPTGKEFHILTIRIAEMLQTVKAQVRNHYNREAGCYHIPKGYDSLYTAYTLNDYVAVITRNKFGYLMNPFNYHSKKIRRALHFNPMEWSVFSDKLLRVYGIIIKEGIVRYTALIQNGTNI